jgi:SpoVK/Ycf46/Vps4 family AAA+-type ATPase/CheY-like chemotaxis protein
MAIRVLICDDDPAFARTLRTILGEMPAGPFEFVTVRNSDEALQQLSRATGGAGFDLMFLDVRMRSPEEGLEALPKIREITPDLPVVINSGTSDFSQVRRALVNGAQDYLRKDFEPEEVLATVQRVLKMNALSRDNKRLASEVTQSTDLLVGQTPVILELRKTIAKFKTSPLNILITGETGTGKEVVARLLRQTRPDGTPAPFIAIDSGTIQSTMAESLLFGHEKGAFTGADHRRIGLFEEADGGTIYFDELSSMPLDIQAKLLRVLQEKEFYRLGGNQLRSANFRVIAATNRPDVLDPALLRPGRFDRRVTMDLPDINEREQILRIHSKGKPVADSVDVRRLAERTPGFSGADLANLVNEAAILATRRDKKTIDMDELILSIEKVILGPERKSKVMNPREKEIVAYHEGGHALVAASLPHADPVHKVSIVSRGHAGGYTLAVPSEDKYLHSEAYFLDELATLLGGYASEKLVFNDTTTGPSNDLERATHMARSMVTRYGMSQLGARTFGHKDELVFLGKELHEDRNYSEETAERIDKEVTRLIDDAFNKATSILTQHRETLNTLATTLLEKETIEKDEFEALIKRSIPSASPDKS